MAQGTTYQLIVGRRYKLTNPSGSSSWSRKNAGIVAQVIHAPDRSEINYTLKAITGTSLLPKGYVFSLSTRSTERYFTPMCTGKSRSLV